MTPAVTDFATFKALGDGLGVLLPTGVGRIRGVGNRVPEPAAADFVVMTATRRARISTGEETWEGEAPETIALDVPMQLTFQLDVHGPLSADNAQVLSSVLRNSYAVEVFAAQTPAILTPLYADEPQFLPFLNDQQQVEMRWVVMAYFEARPVLSTPAQFANTLAITTALADSGAA